MTLFCGIDWAEAHHDIAIVDGDGQLVAKKRIADDPDGFGQLVELLTDAGDCAEDPVPVALETPRGLLVAALRATGRPVYAINPLAVARYRERHSVARSKSDHADAMTLANILRVDAHLHRRLPADSELCQAIAVLARAHQDAICGAPRRTTNCGRCCVSSTRPSWPYLPAGSRWALPAPWPAPCCGSRPPRQPQPSCQWAASVRPCAALGAAAASTKPPPRSKPSCVSPNCDNHFWSRPRWANTPSRCWPRLMRRARTSTNSAGRLRSCFRPIPTTRSSPASRGWRTRPAPGYWQGSATTVPGSPTRGRLRPTPDPHPSPGLRALVVRHSSPYQKQPAGQRRLDVGLFGRHQLRAGAPALPPAPRQRRPPRRGHPTSVQQTPRPAAPLPPPPPDIRRG